MADQSSGNNGKKRPKPGILRLDITKPRRSSGGSVEFRSQPELLGEGIESPAPQVTTATTPQLSVTWASQYTEEDPNQNDEFAALNDSDQMQSHVKSPAEVNDKKTKRSQNLEKQRDSVIDIGSSFDVQGEYNSEDEDYSLSVSAIMQRRASVRGYKKKGYRSPRRASSPMDNVLGTGDGDRRRSSVYTTSSGDTALSLEEDNQHSKQDQILENIRLHKEVLQSVKFQPWSMKRKLRLVGQAKAYITRHEGVLQERFAMSRSTKDWWARFKIVMAARWLHWKRELVNFSANIIPWERRIKEIESHFGSAVASYFIFLRWLSWVNIILVAILSAFVILPEWITSDFSIADDRKQITPGELKVAGDFMKIYEFEGYLKYSPLFYGYYSYFSGAVRVGYNLPLAYFLTGLVVYIYSFVATLRKMAENSRSSKLSSKDDECVFSWKLFTGWDFMIGHAETAHNRVASVVLGFKEALLEEAEKKKDTRNWKVILLRICVNILVIGLLAASAYVVVLVVERSEYENEEDDEHWWRRNEISIVLNLITFFFPMIFEFLGLFEGLHPRMQLRLQLARIMVLHLINLYSLIFAQFNKIGNMMPGEPTPDDTCRPIILENITSTIASNITWTEHGSSDITDFLENITDAITWNSFGDESTTESYMELLSSPSSILPVSSTINFASTSDSTLGLGMENGNLCFGTSRNCSNIMNNTNALLTTTLLLLNLTTTALPNLWNNITTSSPLSVGWLPENKITISPPGLITDGDVELSSILPTSFQQPDPTPTEEIHFLPFDPNDPFDYYAYYTEYPNESENLSLSSTLNSLVTSNYTHQIQKRDLGIHEPKTTETILNTDNITHGIDRLLTEMFESITSEISSTVDTFTDDNLTFPDNITELFESTLSTFLENVTYYLDNIENATEYQILLSEKVYDFIGNFSMEPDSDDSDTNTKCKEEPCFEINQITTQIRDFADLSSTSSGTTPITTGIDLSIHRIDTTTVPSTPSTTVRRTSTKKLKTTTTTSTTIAPTLPGTTVQSVTDPVESEKKQRVTTCWETMFGQEMVKIIVSDLILTIFMLMVMDFIRALFVRYFNNCWCWDLEKIYPGYGDFKIAENILHLVNNQGQVWMGMFFSPGIVIINLIKMIILMYIRSWAVLTCNVPHEVVFRAARSNNFYLALLLTMLFLCVLPVAYAIVWLQPSKKCGPFSEKEKIYILFTQAMRNALPPSMQKPLDYIASPSTVIPLLLLLILIIYYLISLTGALREANQDLKNQLRKERTEERRKMLRMAEKLTEATGNTITSRWKKVLDASSPLTPTGAIPPPDYEESKAQARKDLLARIMKKALRKGSATSEDESFLGHGHGDGDETDTENHDSLPHDEEGTHRTDKSRKARKPTTSRRGRKPSLIDIVQLARRESGAHESHPKMRFKINKNGSSSESQPCIPKEPAMDDNDPDANSRIVSERRRSLLKRQNKVNDLSELPEIQTNYEIVNEKNKQADAQHSILKSSASSKPNVFKFDDKSIKSNGAHATVVTPINQQAKNVEPEENTNGMDVLRKLIRNKQAAKQKALREAAAAKEQEIVPFAKANKSITPPKEKQPSPSTSGEHSNGSKNRKKLASFLTMVKDAVKKPDSDHSKDSSEQSSSPGRTTPIKGFDKSTSPKVSSSKRTPERAHPEKHSQPTEDSQRQPKHDRAPKRQDSQASIWSENIPVITISKTESNECILEGSDKEPNGTKHNKDNKK